MLRRKGCAAGGSPRYAGCEEKCHNSRQNSIFKDFFNLAEYETDKERFLYITGIQQPLKFFQGGRALKSVMSLNSKVWKNFQDKYGSRFEKVQNYYKYRKDRVRIVDLNTILPSFLDFSRRGE